MSTRQKVCAALYGGVLLTISCAAAGCGGPAGPRLSDAAERGRATFAAFCASCHNYRNPFADGGTGPAIARSSKELLQNKVLFGRYPDGYTPKRPGAISMPTQPNLKDRIDDLHAFLNEVPDPAAKPAEPK